jgi:hypothetical protein
LAFVFLRKNAGPPSARGADACRSGRWVLGQAGVPGIQAWASSDESSRLPENRPMAFLTPRFVAFKSIYAENQQKSI